VEDQGLTGITAAQYAPQHTGVNTVLPGLMKTPMIEKSIGLAASGEAKYVTGIELVFDGGIFLKCAQRVGAG
jgi:NAD(P)-dependent dehydrogenase (short-subunit alcohol dehydrogenase family)